MRCLLHSIANRVAALLLKLLFGCVARVRVLRRENANRDGGFLLTANHISHFDPFIISSVVRRKIDWMAMAEFFPLPLLGFLLRAVDAFPADRHRADRVRDRDHHRAQQREQRQHQHHAERVNAQTERQRQHDQHQRLAEHDHDVAQRATEQQREPRDRRHAHALDDPAA
jgi:1-acyl-sn-glycerol-3-phosphate acyltransferase